MQELITFKFTKKILLKELLKIYSEAKWLKNPNKNKLLKLQKMIKNSFIVICAYNDKGSLIGIARAISDKINDAYIQDVYVLKKYRGLNIGKILIQLLIKRLLKKDIKWIGLIAAPGLKNFYKKLNFKEMKNHIPMLYKNKN